jgi:hypothetical protein
VGEGASMTKLLWRQCADIFKLFHHYGQVVATCKPNPDVAISLRCKIGMPPNNVKPTHLCCGTVK